MENKKSKILSFFLLLFSVALVCMIFLPFLKNNDKVYSWMQVLFVDSSQGFEFWETMKIACGNYIPQIIQDEMAYKIVGYAICVGMYVMIFSAALYAVVSLISICIREKTLGTIKFFRFITVIHLILTILCLVIGGVMIFGAVTNFDGIKGIERCCIGLIPMVAIELISFILLCAKLNATNKKHLQVQ